MIRSIDVDYNFGRKHAHENTQVIVSKNLNGKYTISVNCFKNTNAIAEFDHLVNAEKVKAELIVKYTNLSDGGNTKDFQKMITQNRPEANGPFFLILLKTLDIPL